MDFPPLRFLRNKLKEWRQNRATFRQNRVDSEAKIQATKDARLKDETEHNLDRNRLLDSIPGLAKQCAAQVALSSVILENEFSNKNRHAVVYIESIGFIFLLPNGEMEVDPEGKLLIVALSYRQLLKLEEFLTAHLKTAEAIILDDKKRLQIRGKQAIKSASR
jgi:hypothetical protein